jgi:hypothetical protein
LFYEVGWQRRAGTNVVMNLVGLSFVSFCSCSIAIYNGIPALQELPAIQQDVFVVVAFDRLIPRVKKEHKVKIDRVAVWPGLPGLLARGAQPTASMHHWVLAC